MLHFLLACASTATESDAPQETATGGVPGVTTWTWAFDCPFEEQSPVMPVERPMSVVVTMYTDTDRDDHVDAIQTIAGRLNWSTTGDGSMTADLRQWCDEDGVRDGVIVVTY